MCTALLSIDRNGQVLLVGVRDEMLARAWEPPARHWPELPGLIGGRDLQAGGTWLAVSPDDRRAACVLNGRGQQAPAATRRSRGELPLLAALGKPLDRSTLAYLDPFHLLTAEPGRATLQSWDGQNLIDRELPPGLHLAVNSGLASDLLRTSPAIRAATSPAATSLAPSPASDPASPAATSPASNPASQLPTDPPPASQPTVSRPPAGRRTASQPAANQPPAASPRSENGRAENGRAHELARITYFLPKFAKAARPDPRPGDPVAKAWGEWFPLLNGADLPTGDQRALIVRHDFGDGRVWGTGSISLVALSPTSLRYDFTASPGDPAAWYQVA
jgi:Transport and Golgi organisation 2